MSPSVPAEFSVDTGLFRQLGELLVGRDSTALAELIKNAYDADATTVILSGENLGSLERSIISLADNGTGMTDEQFQRGFLRVAARGKAQGDRRSPIYRRRFTGEKGVGRLAAHKLAARIDITSVASVDRSGHAVAHALREQYQSDSAEQMIERLDAARRSVVKATIDWDVVELADTLADVEEGLVLEAGVAARTAPRGTELRLTRLRHEWTTEDLSDLARQLSNFSPPASLVERLPKSVLPRSLLFQEPVVRDGERSDPGLRLELAGEFTNPEEFWGNTVRSAEWVLEIRAARGADVQYSLTPTAAGRRSNLHGTPLVVSWPHPAPDIGPFFDARILLRSGQVPTLESSWSAQNSGVRVYLEGFRVLPYGEVRNDWLGLDFDYTRRSGRFEIDPLVAGPNDELRALRNLSARNVSLRVMPNRNYFGAVFLTEAGAGGLRTLVNREGFVSDEPFDRLVRTVRIGIDLLQRAWALASYTQKRTEATPQGGSSRSAPRPSRSPSTDGTQSSDENGDERPESGADDDDRDDGNDDETELRTVVDSTSTNRGSGAALLAGIAALREALGLPPRDQDADQETGATANLAPETDRIVNAIGELERASDRLIEDASLLRVLASVGAQLTAFSHEIALLIPTALSAERSLEPQPGSRWPSEAVHARRAIGEVRRALERQASYLIDVASTEGRRRRSRLALFDRVSLAILSFQGTAAALSVELDNLVDPELRTPPMFSADLQGVLTNLLSNALKAAGSPGRVVVSAVALPNGVRLLLQNTGIRVDPLDGEHWFVPYASTTVETDPVLGQGMGLGLPITRDLIAEYGGTVQFVEPTAEFATAIEVVIPE